jgi:hypothetical protein
MQRTLRQHAIRFPVDVVEQLVTAALLPLIQRTSCLIAFSLQNYCNSSVLFTCRRTAMAPGPSLKQKIQQKLLKPKYTPHTDDEALHLCNPARANSSDIVLDAVSSRGSSRPASTDPNSADAHAYHDITASLLDPTDAAAAGRSDQGTHSSTAVKPSRVSGPFKGCLPFGKPPVPKSTPAKKAAPPNDGLPTAFNNRGSILSRLSKAARKSPVPTSPPQPKPKPAPKAAPVKTKVCQINLDLLRSDLPPCCAHFPTIYAMICVADRARSSFGRYNTAQTILQPTLRRHQGMHRNNMHRNNSSQTMPCLFDSPFTRWPSHCSWLPCTTTSRGSQLLQMPNCSLSHHINPCLPAPHHLTFSHTSWHDATAISAFHAMLFVALQKVAHPLHMAAWRTNINELQEQLAKPGADANKRDKVCMYATCALCPQPNTVPACR